MSEDLIGADLSVTGDMQLGDQQAAAAPAQPAAAPPGFTRDTLGNIYQDTATTGTVPTAPAAPAVPPPAQQPSNADMIARAQHEQALREMAQQVAQAREAAALLQREQAQREQAEWEAQVRQLPPELQELAVRERVLGLREQQLQAATQAQQNRQLAWEPIFKQMAVQDLVREYSDAGVRPEDLARFNDPGDMEHFCRIMRERGRQATLQQRASTGIDRAAGATGAPAQGARGSWRSQSLSQQLASVFD